MFPILLLAIVANAAQYSCPNDTACIFVDNQCPFTLYLQRTSIDGDENSPTTVTTMNADTQTVLDIAGWNGLPGQRLYAWWQNPMGNTLNLLTYRDKVEINWCFTSPNKMCYNPTAVDYFGLPLMIGPYHSSDCPSVPMTGQYNIDVADMESECPTQYAHTSPAGVCWAPSRICEVNATKPICSHFDTVLQQCIADGICEDGVTTTQVYACSGWFSSQPELCAALNRGVYGSTDQNDASLFYKNSPYSLYSSWIHTGGAKEYAFPYDDWQGDGSSGYQQCETNFLSVTFCTETNQTSTTPEPYNTLTTGSKNQTNVKTTLNPTVHPISVPTTSPTSAESMNKDGNKYSAHDVVIAVVAFIFGVFVSFVLMGVFMVCKRKQQEQRRESFNEQLLGSDDNIEAQTNQSVNERL